MAKRKMQAHNTIKFLKTKLKSKGDLEIRDRVRAVIYALEGQTNRSIADRLDYSFGWVKKWIARYKKEGVDGLYDQQRQGAPTLLTAGQIDLLKAKFLAGPDPQEILSRYRVSDLVKWVWKEFKAKYSHSGMHALMKRMNLSHVKPRPQHSKNDPLVMEEWKKKAQAFIKKQSLVHPEKQIQVWYQDEARFGQKGIVSKIWTTRGIRPTLIKQNGFKSAYFNGAVNPKTGKKYCLIYDGMDTRVMNHFLKNIGNRLDANVQAVMIMDGAGWHSSEELVVPPNITLYYLPPYSPELNPIEQIWGYLKSNYLSGRVFKNITEIFSYGVRAWRELTMTNIKSICSSRLLI